MTRLLICLIYLSMGGLLLALPQMSRRGVLFGVPVPPNFRDSEPGRHSLAVFRTVTAIVIFVSLIAMLFSPERLLSIVILAAHAGTLLIAGLAFWWQNRKLMPAAVQPVRVAEAAITVTPERLPSFAWLGAGPFLFLGMAALFLEAHWSQIPARFAVHWGLDGLPDRWSERTFRGVYGPLVFGAGLCVSLFVMALATWFGSRRSPMRRVLFGTGIASEYLVGCLLSVLAIGPLVRVPLWAILLGTAACVALMLMTVSRAMAEPGGRVEATPNSCWKLGLFYFNPVDSALFVEKRIGIGYAVNYGNPLSWLVMIGLVVSVGLGMVFL